MFGFRISTFNNMFGFTKSPAFQFLINPSTLFIISGMLVAKYRDDPVVQDVHTPNLEFSNSTLLFPFTNPLHEQDAPKHVSNRTSLETYNLLDPITVLEMRLISLIIQGYDNSTEWQFKFVDLPPNPDKSFVQASYLPPSYYSPPLPEHIQRKANVLITDAAQELVPIWVVVNLSTGKVESWTRGKHGGNGNSSSSIGKISKEEHVVAGEIALADVKVQQRMQSLGYYKDIYDVVPDIWDAGLISQNPQERLVQIYFYGMRKEDGEPFAFPLNFVAYAELGKKNIVRAIQDLPLYQPNAKKTTGNNMPAPNTSFFSSGMLLPPNTIRSELFRFNGANDRYSFKISGSEELQR